MDKYLNIQCVKGLIMSLDEQLYKYFDKDNLPENLRNKIVNSYYDAIKEQLDKPEKVKEDLSAFPTIIINGLTHGIFAQKISWEQVVLLSNLAKTGSELFTISYSKGDIQKPTGTLEVGETIIVNDGMIFNIINTSKA